MKIVYCSSSPMSPIIQRSRKKALNWVGRGGGGGGKGEVSEEWEHVAGIVLEVPEAVGPWDGDT